MKKFSFIIVTGLGWSGSSALIDFFYDQKVVTGFNSDYPDETKYLKKKSYGDPKTFFGNKRRYLEINKYDLIAILSGGEKGIETAINKNKIIQIFNKFEKIKNKIDVSNIRILDYTSKFVGDSSIFFNGYREFTYFYEKFLKMLIYSLKKEKNKYTLFNNDVYLHERDNFIKINEALKIIVYRNPFDQYSDKKQSYKISGFIDSSKLLLHFLFLSYKQAFLIAKNNNSIDYLINFESLVMDVDYRNELFKKFFQLESDDLNYNKFRPEESKKNIYKPRENLIHIEKILLFILISLPYFFIKNSKKNFIKEFY